MSSSPFQYQPLSAVKRKQPALDIVSAKAACFRPAVYSRAASFVPSATPAKKNLDGVGRDRHSFLMLLKEQSLGDSLKRSFRKGQLYFRRMRRFLRSITPETTPQKMVYGSIMGGIAFGMVSMAFIAHFLGAGVFAQSDNSLVVNQTIGAPMVTGPASSDTLANAGYDPEQDVFFEYFGEVTKEQYEKNIGEMVKGYPIESMLPYIFEQDRLTAAFLIGIAKKESNWGKRIPVLDGQDCFNYWGYRGIRRMMGSGGHTCFNSRKDAVETVAKRISTLANSEKLDTPEKMIVWKCGFSCQGHSRESVKKWISDVDMYFSQLSDE